MDDVVRVEDGKGVVFKRNGKFQARIRVGPNKYVYRALKVSSKAAAIKAAERLCHELEFRVAHGIPVIPKKFVDVIDEYVAYRTKQNLQGGTTAGMLRQIVRVAKFWRAYAGNKSMTDIDDAALRSFVEWRKDYYSKFTDAEMPRNAKRNPADKTLQWDVMLGRAIVKWASEKGYRGNAPLPTYNFVPKTKRVRPAFELTEYRKLWRGLIKWERTCTNPKFLPIRQLLRDYVLILSNSGMRVGEANNLRVQDVQPLTDDLGRYNYRFIVRGKTGPRDVIPLVSAVKYVKRLMARKRNPKGKDWLFAMPDGSKIITLTDQFNKVLKLADIERNSAGEKYSLYSLRHFYAVMNLRRNVTDFTVGGNMGTSTPIIKGYYGKQATPLSMATTLGGPMRSSKTRRKHEEDAD